jgi:protein arginine kinase activator
MKCEKCQNQTATVHLTEIKSGRRNETHLCEDCARSMNLPHQQPISISDLIGTLLESGQKKVDPKGEAACPECGIRFSEFKAGGRLGCAHDYEFFKDQLEPLLKKVHGAVRYTGKVPKGADVEPAMQEELKQLKKRLQKVIAVEEYEEAARIRDRIVELENLVGSSGKSTKEVED